MPTHQSVASAINLVEKENEQAPRPVEAEALIQPFGIDEFITDGFPSVVRVHLIIIYNLC